MPTQPKKVEIRSYQVGFGDCFLLSFVYSAKDARHVLIDFGTTALPKRGKPLKAAKPGEYMPTIAKDIQGVCGKAGLTAVVATHRHKDHISGFGTDAATGDSGSIIKALRPKVVLQPWTEDPKAKRDAKSATADSNRTSKGFVASLSAMQMIADQVAALAGSNPSGVSAEVKRELSFLGSENIANKSAVDNLIAMGAAKGTTPHYLRFGSSSGLEKLLPGVKVTVLGPPDLTQSEKIRTMRKRDPDQFWHLLSGTAGLRGDSNLTNGLAAHRKMRSHKVPVEARWFRDRLQQIRGQSVLEIVRALDDQMNNTSLILLFEACGKKLLFPGDAQIENWSYALRDAKDAAKIRALLTDVDVYKVGHHGSLNATPRKLLWETFTKRKGKKLKTILSTLPGKHGNPRSKTEVPRKTLLTALESESRLKATTGLKFGQKPVLFNLVEVP